MIEKQLLRAVVLEILNNGSVTQVNHVIDGVERLIIERGLFPSQEDCQQHGVDYQHYHHRQLNPTDRITIGEIIWELILDNILIQSRNDLVQF